MRKVYGLQAFSNKPKFAFFLIPDEDKSSIVSVSDDLILAGEKYLRDFQTRHIPGTFRRDGDWEVSLVPKGIRKKQ